MILDLFLKKKCSHSKVPPQVEAGYCPDCGEYVENHWFLVRCKHCKIKRKSHLLGENVVPDTKFCPNCGGFLYEVEKLEKINFIDINFAALKREVVKIVKKFAPATTWVEEEETTQKLISAIN
ncbi:hypothetical protein IJS77_04995 [bacterium]|nr:hypothetical protein [bacterium]